MKEFAKYIGVIVMLIGVAFLIVPFFMGTITNTNLIIGMALIINGMLGYIYTNNMKKGNVVSNILWAIFLFIVPFIIYFFAKKNAYSEEELAAYN
ncbi:MAG: hypothetical protein KA433_00550 [Fermentimonas sp.]|jgi:uncharacterized membrane protein HdeD (DUF308 family)|uniref:Uncharacterized protein n=2 Tax=Bacteroidales TaxID=171549 RepID=A0A098C241_9BACT|nr:MULTISPECIES: hypothetical protein [Lascolabacillus]MBP6175581.1 hypothetical protein [Fermentimonas sp.]MDI9626380.1 hypothetical protein [Bacteroidota bacterium]TAH61968.1 MAG: hypothetical protein EWM46_03170 [Fermentimonas caenicola]MBP6195993.1 hypothetical protein [Fermentimonas sp.]MBP7104204.1 hypothetical protein [Fermentimonas sp.]